MDLIEEEIAISIEKIRPPKTIRNELDYGYCIEKNAVLILEIRTDFLKKEKKIQTPIAKIKFVMSKKIWKLYWMKGNIAWSEYPKSDFKTFSAAIKIIKKDEENCFFG
jgi:hypothetical protein